MQLDFFNDSQQVVLCDLNPELFALYLQARLR